ncbi:MFS transporter [Roseomonas sp. CCTCC AB2023176]|uniref:MFS transporter n=1 Tax=Roseomonas sp. CCTCC AB2023176 TaxID=3342640 RepID=UPI0035E1CDC3
MPGGLRARILASPLARALGTRNARVFFGASLGAWTGMWMHRIGVAWLGWQLTGSAAWVGAVAFADLAPAVLFSPIAGAVADRLDRVRLTMAAQCFIAVQATTVAALAATDTMTIGLLVTLEFLGGIGASFAQPARQSLMPGLVGRSDLPAAVAANSLIFNVARFVGPGLAGPIIAVSGVAPAIACNALGYAFASLSMLRLTVAPEDRRGHPATKSLFGEMTDGLRYAARHPGLGPLLGFAAVAAILLRGVQEILPPYVERLFGRGAESLALLTTCFAAGALFFGLIVAARGRLAGTTRIVVVAILAQAVATLGFVATGWFPFAMFCAALIGGAATSHGTSVQVLAQLATTAEMRGRIMALWGMITRACPAVGALCLGGAGDVFGLRVPTIVAAVLGILVAVWGLSRLRRMAAVLEAPERG